MIARERRHPVHYLARYVAQYVATALLLVGLSLASAFAHADERILDFHSAISVQTDGAMEVRETIRVQAERQQIRHGIYRDLPLNYRDPTGLHYRVGFKLLQVLRDGLPEPYHTKNLSNGIRIYMGNKDFLLKPGIYSYTLVYRTNRQLGFFADHDELYWNVTGNGWIFPIDHASALVTLPSAVPRDAVHVEAYTGPQGAKGKDYRAEVTTDGQAEFATTRTLPSHAGLTIVVTWPKGYIQRPDTAQRLHWWFADNQSAVIAGTGLILLLGYFLIAWYRVGRDPESGVIIPHYLPPDGLSPAALRFIRNMGYDNKAFSSALVGLAAKGYFKIDEQGDEFALERQDGPTQPLTPSEDALNKALLKQPTYFVLRQDNHAKIQATRKAHEQALRREYEARNFRLNSKYLWIGSAILLAIYAIALLAQTNAEDKFTGLFMSAWLGIWSIGVYMLATRAFMAWRLALRPGRSILSVMGAMGATIFALPFVGGEIFGTGMLIHSLGIMVALLLVSGIALSLLFHHLLKAPTLAGRRLLDRIEGFRLYLSVAEANDLKMTHTPCLDKQMFESYLPYAMALDVEDAWSHRFEQSLRESGISPASYTGPAWYGGYGSGQALTGLGSAFSSAMTDSIAAAGTSPGSSSGSGGGGSSGGGGGGGGGGGW
ncbi:MAG TPA: DUF2207 domain-containing protein [Rhodocyclaceae bacterium]|nr:DUF2207 domain-containing protein [Rhodocyclaceae bacterium]